MEVRRVDFVDCIQNPTGGKVPLLRFRVETADGRSWLIPLEFTPTAAQQVYLVQNLKNGRPHAWLRKICRHYIAVSVHFMKEDDDPPNAGEWLIPEEKLDFVKRQAKFSIDEPGKYLPKDQYSDGLG